MVVRVSVQIGILLLLVGLTVAPFGAPLVRPAPVEAQVVPAPGVEPDTCHGDEVISFAPPDAVVGAEMLIAVTSAQSHSGLYMAGTERVTTSTETVGQLGHVWLWSVTPRLTGPHRFQFFIDFTKFCTEATIDVKPNPLGATDPLTVGTPIPGVTDLFPTPTPFPPFNDNSFNSNSFNDNSGDSNGNSDDSNGNLGNVNDNIEKIRTPIIDAVSCTSVARKQVNIKGRRFGSSRTAAAGQVFVQKGSTTPVEAATYLAWNGSDISVIVTDGFDHVYVVNSAGFDAFDKSCF